MSIYFIGRFNNINMTMKLNNLCNQICRSIMDIATDVRTYSDKESTSATKSYQ